MQEVKRESFEELVKKAKLYAEQRSNKKKHNQAVVKVRKEKHYTLMPLTLERIEEIKEGNRSDIIKHAIFLLTGILECIGEENMKILALVEKVIVRIENSDLKEANKKDILVDLAQVIQLIENRSLDNLDSKQRKIRLQELESERKLAQESLRKLYEKDEQKPLAKNHAF